MPAVWNDSSDRGDLPVRTGPRVSNPRRSRHERAPFL